MHLLPASFLFCPFWHLPFTLFKNIHSGWIWCKMKTVKLCKMSYTNIKWRQRNAFWLKAKGHKTKGSVLVKATQTPEVQAHLLAESIEEDYIMRMPAPHSWISSLMPAYSRGPASFRAWLQKLGIQKFVLFLLKNTTTVYASVNLTI